MIEQIQNKNIDKIPLIDLQKYTKNQQNTSDIAHQIRQTCKNTGFFYIKNHGVSQKLQSDILANAAKFFSLPHEQKMKIHMSKGRKAWRGFFAVGEQLTSGKIDIKQGIYLGQQISQTHPSVQENRPLHGQNLFPEQPAQLKNNILDWLSQMDRVGGILMEAIAQSLYLERDYFKKGICKEHLGLLRIFHYPVDTYNNPQLWAVGQHTDYGLLTILMISQKGLQVQNRNNQWLHIDPIPNTFVINIGDILQKMTKGLYKSTPHRARNIRDISRFSIPYFYDPGWNQQIKELDIKASEGEIQIIKKSKEYQRWDNMKLETISGKYGKYLISKISKVFPELAKQNL